VLLALIAAIFWRIIGESVPGEKFRTTRNSLRLLTCAWLFLLCQGENLTLGSNVQFFLTFLLPLCALYFLQKSQAGASNPRLHSRLQLWRARYSGNSEWSIGAAYFDSVRTLFATGNFACGGDCDRPLTAAPAASFNP
jgi:hypothetical protein